MSADLDALRSWPDLNQELAAQRLSQLGGPNLKYFFFNVGTYFCKLVLYSCACILLVLVCCDFVFIGLQVVLFFPFHFFFVPLIVQDGVVKFPHIWIYSFPLVILFSSVSPSWSEKILDNILSCWILRLVLWPNIC